MTTRSEMKRDASRVLNDAMTSLNDLIDELEDDRVPEELKGDIFEVAARLRIALETGRRWWNE